MARRRLSVLPQLSGGDVKSSCKRSLKFIGEEPETVRITNALLLSVIIKNPTEESHWLFVEMMTSSL